MATPGLDSWKAALAHELGINLTPAVSQYFDLWSRAEGGGAANNPFNTTQPGFGATGNYNSVGVKNYGDPMAGIKATAATLKNGRYNNILAALKQGTDPKAMAEALYNSPWGTGGLVLKMLGGSPLPQGQPPGNIPAPGAGPTPPAPRQASAPPGSISGAMMPTKLDQLVNNAAPSNFGVSILDRLGGMAGKIAQAEQARIPFAPKFQPSGATTGQLPTPDNIPATGTGKVAAGIAETALTQRGIPYKWGGQAKLGSPTDCSGLLQASAAANGIKIGRTTYQQWKEGTPVPLNQIQKGDAVFFHMGKRGPEHVGIYIGQGRIVEDPHTGASVHISELAGRGAVGARRYG